METILDRIPSDLIGHFVKKYELHAWLFRVSANLTGNIDKMLESRDPEIAIVAAKSGHLDFIKYLYSLGFILDPKLSNEASKYGHLELVSWLHHNKCRDYNNNYIAAKHGHFELVKWFHNNGYPKLSKVTSGAAKSGNMEMFYWLCENEGYPWTSRVYASAAQNGHLNIFKYAFENGCPLDEEIKGYEPDCFAVVKAGCKGHINILEYALAIGFRFDDEFCMMLGEHGQLKVLQWFHVNVREVDNMAHAGAITYDYLHVLKWLHFNVEPCDDTCYLQAACCKRIHIMDWLFEVGCPWTDGVIKDAEDDNNTEVLEWARAHKFI